MSLNTETLFQTLGLMTVAGGKQEKERKETTRAGLHNQGPGKERRMLERIPHVQQGDFEEARDLRKGICRRSPLLVQLRGLLRPISRL